MMLRKRVPVIVPLHEIANVATPDHAHHPPTSSNARSPSHPSSSSPHPPSPVSSIIHHTIVPSSVPPPLPSSDTGHGKPPMRPLRKNKRLRPNLASQYPPPLHENHAPRSKYIRLSSDLPIPSDVPNKTMSGVVASNQQQQQQQQQQLPSTKASTKASNKTSDMVNPAKPRRDDREKEATPSMGSESHGSTVCSPATSVLASNDDVSTEALMKIVPIAKQVNIVWTKIKGHPFWPAQYVRMSPDLLSQGRFKNATKFRRRVDDICVMYFGTCEVAFVNAQKSCISWEEGLRRNMHLSHKSRAMFQRSLMEVKAFCHRNTRYPRGWWCEPQCMILATEFFDQCIGAEVKKRLSEIISRAEAELVLWAKMRGFPHWPVQVMPRNMAAVRFPQLKMSTDNSFSSSSLPCMFFGTGEVAMVAEKNLTPFGAGVVRGYVSNSDRQDFTVAIGEIWGYLQQPRIWPSGYLSGNLWWNYEDVTDNNSEHDSTEVRVPHMPHYNHIRKSVWLNGIEPPNKPKHSEMSGCGCVSFNGKATCIDSHCLNFASRFFCNALTCEADATCGNVLFHKRKLPRLKPFFTADQRGWGLKVEEEIKSGAFVIEYVGEIIDRSILEKRLKEAQKQHSNEYYMMDLTNDLLVDAKLKGNLSRFINSSCEPNCATQKWTDAVTGQTHVGIFALRDIAKGTELTYNYCFEDFGLSGKSQKRSFMCQCGTSSCCMLSPEEKNLMKSLVGKRVEVRWDDGWYPGLVETYNLKKKRFLVQYDDGDCEDLVLGLTTEDDDGVAFRLVEKEGRKEGRKEARKEAQREEKKS